MGTTNYVYVGTYALLTIPKTTNSYDRDGCVNKDCKRFEKSQIVKFCNCCGHKLGSYTVEVTDYDHPSEFLDEKDEDIFLFWMEGEDIPENQYIALLNDDIPQIGITIDTYEAQTEFSLPIAIDSIYIFKEKYEKQLQQFEDRGVKVEIKYGIVNYYI